MRYATVIVSWVDIEFHPLTEIIRDYDEVSVETTYFVNPIGDGTVVELSQFRGDMAVLRDAFSASGNVLDHKVTDEGITYAHYETTEWSNQLLAAVFAHPVVLQWPVEFVHEDDSLQMKVTLMGTEESLSAATTALRGSFDVRLLRTGDYAESLSDPRLVLSDKQWELLEEAMESGYYEIPRETTQEELADDLGITHATVSDRLRRIEATLIETLMTQASTHGT